MTEPDAANVEDGSVRIFEDPDGSEYITVPPDQFPNFDAVDSRNVKVNGEPD